MVKSNVRPIVVLTLRVRKWHHAERAAYYELSTSDDCYGCSRATKRTPTSKNPKCTGRRRVITAVSAGIFPSEGPSLTLIVVPILKMVSVRTSEAAAAGCRVMKTGGATKPSPALETLRVGTWNTW